MSDNNQLNILLLGATFETGNMGVRALTAGAIKCLLSQYPNARISLLDYSKTSRLYTLNVDNRKISIPLVNMRFSKRLFLPNNIAVLLLLAIVLKLIPFRKLRDSVAARNKCLRHILTSNIVGSIAGGDSFSDIYGLERLLYISLPQILVLLMGRRLILLPQTIGPFEGWLARRAAGYILRRAECVYSRDRRSLRETERFAGPALKAAKFKFCYDVAFALDSVPPPHLQVAGLLLERKDGKNLVGVNVSGLLLKGGYNRNNMFGLRIDYQDLVHGLIDLLVTKLDVKVLLIPHVFGADPGSESDQPACGQIYEALKGRYGDRLGLLQGDYDQSEIKHVIGQCDFFVGARMHACIAAISQNVPAVCIAYSKKFIGVMETIGIESLVADARSLSLSDIFKIVEQGYERRALIRTQLERKIPEVKLSVLGLLGGLPGAEPKVATLEPVPASAQGL
ncbi:MAG: polysaccharide pyruvyl transferase family protein [Bryobacteraceae bacterium]